MRFKNVFLFAVFAIIVTGGAHAAAICTRYYTKCNDGSAPSNGVCGCIATTASGKCYIKSGTVIRDNAGTITFRADIYED